MSGYGRAAGREAILAATLLCSGLPISYLRPLACELFPDHGRAGSELFLGALVRWRLFDPAVRLGLRRMSVVLNRVQVVLPSIVYLVTQSVSSRRRCPS